MKLIYQASAPASVSPYRLVNAQGKEIVWVNDFLDAQCIRQLSPQSLRVYAYDLLHFARWWELHHRRRRLADLNRALLIDYVRAQLDPILFT